MEHFKEKENIEEGELKLSDDEKLESEIREAKSFDELLQIIEKKGGLQGSRKFYTPEEMRIAISSAMTSGDLGYLTREYGLRKKVSELMEKDNNRSLNHVENDGVFLENARELPEEQWEMQFLGEENIDKFDKFKNDFPNISKEGWKIKDKNINGKLLWTDGDHAIFENKEGKKFIFNFKKLEK